MAKTITIAPMKPFTSEVLLQEFSPEHPNGEAFVYAAEDSTFEVAETAAVIRLLERRRVKRVTAAKTAPAPAPEEDEDEDQGEDEDAEASDEGEDEEPAPVPVLTPAEKAAQTRAAKAAKAGK